jgi:phosphoribosylglycinamide formyltransferase 1
MKRIAIFASGSGTNMQAIATYFKFHPRFEVALVVCNKAGAGVIDRAKAMDIPVSMINRQSFYNSDNLMQLLKKEKIDLIVLAGFLWLVPATLIDAFAKRIINIHPALLPDFGGKGMYGERVHQAVLDSGNPFSGITIHYVNRDYDKGDVIFQAKIKVEPKDTPQSLASKVHKLEYKHYPRIIEQLLEMD